MDPGTVQSGRTTSLQPMPVVTENEVAMMEDQEILRRLIRLLSRSEEDELYAQDARRQPSSSAVHTFHRSRSEGDDTTSVVQLDRSRSVLRLAETAPLRVSRPPKLDLTETYRESERGSTKLRTKLTRLQAVLRRIDGSGSGSNAGTGAGAVMKAASKVSLHLENVTSYMKQQVDILSQADAGPPNEVHARNLSSAFSSLAISTRALARALNELRNEGLFDDMENMDLGVFENLAQLAELEAQSLKDSKADDSLKRMSGIHFRQHIFELNTQLAKLCEDAVLCLSEIIRSLILSLRDRKDRESLKHILRTGIAILFSVITAMMLSVSADREAGTAGTTGLGLASSGIWLISLACGVAAGITGIVGLVLSDVNANTSSKVDGRAQPSGNVLKWLAMGSDMLFLLAATLFSIGLCVFAFSSSQAVVTRVIVIILDSTHFLGLFVLLFWFFSSGRADKDKLHPNPNPNPNPNTNTSSNGNDNNDTQPQQKKRSLWPWLWSSIRSSAGVPIGGGVGGSAARVRSKRKRDRDVEQGVVLRHRVPSYRRSAPPIIRVTDTDRDQDREEEVTHQSQSNADRSGSGSGPGSGNRQSKRTHTRSHARTHTHTTARHSPTNVTNVTRVSNLDLGPGSGPLSGTRTRTRTDDEDSEGDTESASDDTSFSFSQSRSHPHANLAVPSAQRVSSDSSRSLPALPPDVQIMRCMAYSPNGMFLCIGNASPAERCTIFSTDSPAITLGELKLADIALQIEWSEDGENILIRLSHTIYIWNAMPSAAPRRAGLIVYHDSDIVKWLVNGDSFLSCKKDILTSFRIDGTPTGVFQIPATSIQDFVVTKDGQRIICLISNFASTRSERSGGSTQKLVVYNLENKAVEQIAPVGRDALSIVRSTVTPELLLVNFVGTTPPQIWRYRQNTDSSDRRTSATFLSFKRAMSFKTPSGRFAGYGIFGSADDKLVLSLGEDGDMFVFASDTGQPLRHITTNASHASRRRTLNVNVNVNDSGMELLTRRESPLAHCIAWDPDILTFTVCMGYNDGSIWQWKVPFDALSRDAESSTFSVVTLGREDSTVIRPPDVDKTVLHEEDAEGEEPASAI